LKLTRIEESAFSYSGLRCIVIPSSTAIIDGSAFSNVRLDWVRIEVGSSQFRIRDWCLEDFSGHSLVRYFGNCKKVVVPCSIKSLCKSCFQSCTSVESILFENESKLIRIEQFAFYRSGLKSIVIPSSVEVFSKLCFGFCKSLQSIIFENDSKLIQIEELAFCCSGLESFIIPSSVVIIDGSAFSSVQLD
jgi:hypothetical protein